MITWDWKSKYGEMIINNRGNEFTINLYTGNCLLIGLHEFKDPATGEDKYNMYTFFIDDTHAKRCLGLVKGYDSIFDDNTQLVKLRFDKSKAKNMTKLITLFAKAFDNLTIEIYKSEK